MLKPNPPARAPHATELLSSKVVTHRDKLIFLGPFDRQTAPSADLLITAGPYSVSSMEFPVPGFSEADGNVIRSFAV